VSAAAIQEPRVQKSPAPSSDTPPAPAWENPLIPNKKLRALYTAMVELRLLEEFGTTQQRKAKRKPAARLHATPGEEACLVSTLIDLEPGDLVADAHPGIATAFLRGAKLQHLLHSLTAANPNGRRDLHLPFSETGLQRLNVAAGAALTAKSGRLVVAYVRPHELDLPGWQQLLQFAGAHELPLILVVLPPTEADSPSTGRLSRLATDHGVPGILIDAADPVALYRVAQESTQRARAFGGGVLMECIPFPLAAKLNEPTDPIETMERFLLSRQVATSEWMNHIRYKFQQRLAAAAL
jgi:TPP-dependent pyruvate/acetoin dehydrogenase alpha subunit